MAQVIVAGALGVIIIIITGGLFLRRLLGELNAMRRQLTEQGRQITGIERQMHAQRAHVTILRQLLADDGTYIDGGASPQPAIVNGHQLAPPGDIPVRRKGHLGLYIGGGTAALTTLSEVARAAAFAQRSQAVGAIAGILLSAVTITMIATQPWARDARNLGYDWPQIAIPSISVPSAYALSGKLPPTSPAPPSGTTAPPDSPRPPAAAPPAAPSPVPTAASTPAAGETVRVKASVRHGSGIEAAHEPDPGTSSVPSTTPQPTADTLPATDEPTPASARLCTSLASKPPLRPAFCLNR